MARIALIVWILLGMLHSSYGQSDPAQIEVLLTKTKNTNVDTAVKAHLDLASGQYLDTLELALHHTEQALQLAEETGRADLSLQAARDVFSNLLKLERPEEAYDFADRIYRTYGSTKEKVDYADFLNRVAFRSMRYPERYAEIRSRMEQYVEKVDHGFVWMKWMNILGVEAYQVGDYQMAIQYFDSSITYVDQNTEDKEIQRAIAGLMMNAAVIKGRLGRPEEALINYRHAYRAFLEAKDWKNTGNVLVNMASSFSNMGYLDSTIHYANRSIEYYEESKDSLAMATAYDYLGEAYSNLLDYQKALEIYMLGLKIRKAAGDPNEIAVNYMSAGDVYLSLGDTVEAQRFIDLGHSYARQSQNPYTIARIELIVAQYHGYRHSLDSANHYFEKSLAFFQENEVYPLVSSIYNNRGNLYMTHGDPEKALVEFEKAYQIDVELGDSVNLAGVGYNIAVIYKDKGAYTQALQWALASMEIQEKLKVKSQQRDTYELLSQVYGRLGQFQYAYEYLEKYIRLSESMMREDMNEEIAKMRTAHNTQLVQDSLKISRQAEENERVRGNNAELRAEKEHLSAEQQRKQKYWLIAIAGLLAVGVVLVIRTARQRKKANQIIAAEKEKSEQLLLNILPHETAEELKAKGYADPQHFQEVSVLFTDFKGFTMLSEQMSADDLVAELNYCFKGFDEIMSRHGIEKIKTIGDAYMAAGGLPTRKNSHAVDTVRAALDIKTFMNEYKAEREREGRPFFQIRIGVHSGQVVAGIVGIKKFQYDIWGDTVNTAARMESSGEVGEVNVSESTYVLIKDDFDCEYRGEIPAKNKGNLAMYFVRDLK